MSKVSGFRPLRHGRIHLLCRGCGRKQSNAKRREGDPKRAYVCVVSCEKCSLGGFVDGPDDYLFKNGRSLPVCSECRCWIHDPFCSHYRRVALARATAAEAGAKRLREAAASFVNALNVADASMRANCTRSSELDARAAKAFDALEAALAAGGEPETSTDSFTRIWDNPEDAAYDDIAAGEEEKHHA